MRNTHLVVLGLVLLAAATSRAQDAMPPRAVNPGQSDAPADVIRESGLPADAAVVETASESPYLGDPDAGITMPVIPPDTSPPATAVHVAGQEESDWNVTAGLAASVRASYGRATAFLVDPESRATIAPLSTRVRAAPEIHLKGFGFIGEADAATGAILGVPSDAMMGSRVPNPTLSALELRKLYLEYKWATGAFRVGQQTSQWGLGMLANDGARDAAAGDFGQAQFGSLTYRALLGVRPLFNAGGAWRAVETAMAVDLVVRDGSAEFAKGDRAFQGVLAMRFVKNEENQVGLYAVYRNQRAVGVTDGGRATDVVVLDAAGKWELFKRRRTALSVGFEVAGITGSTTQARNENADLLKVRQFGAVAKAAWRVRKTTFLFDWGYASGDQNPNDGSIDAFHFDRDYKVGLVLFDQVLGYQTARGSVRASDPSVVGVAPEGVDLIGSGGSVTGAWYLFPRVKVSLKEWIDVYGGPLFAFTTARLTDPFNTQLAGGTARNALGGRPGSFLGTEIDLGVQARFKPLPELLLSVTGEGGLFLPGDAFSLPSGAVMGPVGFGRIRAAIAL